MASIKLEHIHKKFKSVAALKDVSLEIHNDEFFVVFGPAGAGKTTLLNVIAGNEWPERGTVCFDGKKINGVEPKDRNVSMVFENYALYPNLNAYDNIASPLRSKKYKKSEGEIKAMIEKVSRTMNITELLDRLPSQVSNGQKQRIALGRALVRDPNVFLMDEPLAHLDAKLRNSMRKELKTLQHSLNTTTIYVTHDYTEAMSLADRIAVIHLGEIQQIGTPDEVYYTPVNEFVAKLFGEPEINMIPCTYRSGNISLPWQGVTFSPDFSVTDKLDAAGVTEVDVGFRASNIRYAREPSARTPLRCEVYSLEPLGNRTEIIIRIGSELLRFIGPVNAEAKIGEALCIGFDYAYALFFNSKTTNFLARYGEDRLKRGECIG